jgi:hypothetical protein
LARDHDFGHDQLDSILLPACFTTNGLGEFRIGVQARREVSIVQARHPQFSLMQQRVSLNALFQPNGS